MLYYNNITMCILGCDAICGLYALLRNYYLIFSFSSKTPGHGDVVSGGTPISITYLKHYNNMITISFILIVSN